MSRMIPPSRTAFIVSYGGLITKATDPIHIDSFGQWPPRPLCLLRWLGKPSIEVCFEGTVKKNGGGFRSRNACPPEFLHYTILQRIKQPFDASLGLGRKGKDRLNAQRS